MHDDRLHILIIDDDELDRMMVQRALKAAGADATFGEAADAKTGIRLLREQSFDVALLDHALPDMDGLTALRAIRAADIQTPVILLTGQGDERLAVEMMRAGANDYLSKTRLSRDLLSHSVRNAVRLHRAQTEAHVARSLTAETEQRFRVMADSAPVLLWVTDEQGGCVYVNQGWISYTGRELDQERGTGWAAGIHPDDAEPLTKQWAVAVERRERHSAEFRLRKSDGSYGWVMSSGVPRFTPDGGFLGYVGSCIEITDRKRAEQERAELLDRERAARTSAELARAAAQASEQHYRFLAESIPAIVWTALADGRVDYVNRRWLDYTGLSAEQSVGVGWMVAIHPDDIDPTRTAYERSLRTGDPLDTEVRYRRASDGTYRWHLIRANPLRDRAGNIVKWFGTGTDVEEQKRTRDAMTFLAQASEALASSLNYEVTLGSVAELAVPKVADWCFIDIVGSDGVLRRLTIAHADAEKVELAKDLARRFPIPPDNPVGSANVIRTGRSELYEQFPDEVVQRGTHHSDHADIVRSFGLRSLMVVPMVARGRALGTITLATAETERWYGPADLALAEDLARRAAAAVDNARLYREAQAAFQAQDQAVALLDTLLEKAPVGLAFFDRELRYVRINETLAQINGMPAADHLGKTTAELLPGIPSKVTEDRRRVLETGEPILNVEVSATTHASPSKGRAFLVSSYPVRTSGGDVLGVGAVVVEITELRQAEERLRQSEERYRLVGRATNDVIWDWDLVTNRVDWNESITAHLGYALDKVEPTSDWWYEHLHPDDRERVVNDIHAVIEGRGSSWSAEYRFRKNDGHYATFLDRGFVARDGNGRAYRIIGSMFDLTERMHAAEALRISRERMDLVVASSALGVWYCDLPFDELVWNDTCKEHFGLPADARIKVDTFYNHLHPEDRERTRAAVEGAVDGHQPYDINYRTVSPVDGRVRWVRAIGRAFYDSVGNPTRFDGITMDVTAAKLAQEELERAKAEADAAREIAEAQKRAAEAANFAKDQFLAVLSHELRTPLSPVLSTVTAMESDPSLPPALRDSIDMIRRNVELEARLIDDLLDLTRISKGKLELHLSKTDAHEALTTALDICRSDILDKGLKLQTDLNAARCYVHADSARLHQVFWNLIKNAVKFTPEGGTIYVSTRNAEPAGRNVKPAGNGGATSMADARLIVEVRDTGIGIEPQVLPRIFDAFEQGERSITRKFGGLGLGLAISKALIDMQGGRLTADSAGRSKGAVFCVDLSTVSPPAVRTNGSGPVAGTSAKTDLRILLVDDHLDTALAMRKLLERLGYRVTIANTLADAVTTYRDQPVDLVVSDIGLPDGSGLELIRQINAIRPVPGIALSGFGMEEDIRKSKEAGFFEHLTKPVNFQRLNTVIREATSTLAVPVGTNT